MDWWQIPAYGTCVLGFFTTLLVCYVLVVTARNPTAWANRVVAPPLPDELFIVHGDDLVGLY